MNLRTRCNGTAQGIVRRIDYDAATRSLRDCTGRLTLPGESCTAVIAELKALCKRADVDFVELSTGCDDPAQKRVAPWGQALPRCLCIRPTFGPTAAYTRQAMLHIGISNSAGLVSHLPANNVVDEDEWPDCVCVALDRCELSDEAFDAALLGHVLNERDRLSWAPYQAGANAADPDAENNCFSFCTRFLNVISYAGASTHDKMSLVDRHGISQAVEAIELYQAQQRGEQLGTSADCGGRHGLAEHTTPSAGYRCDVCQQLLAAGTRVHSCRGCDHDVCHDCFAPSADARV